MCAILTGDSRTEWPGRQDLYIFDRLLHRRAAHHQSGRSTQEWHFARAWRCGEFLLAWGDRPDPSGSTLRNGRRYLLQCRACGCGGGSKRAIVITITDGLTPPFYTGVPHRHADKGLNPDLKVIFASYSDALGERRVRPNHGEYPLPAP
jgi:hypothetical protein